MSGRSARRSVSVLDVTRDEVVPGSPAGSLTQRVMPEAHVAARPLAGQPVPAEAAAGLAAAAAADPATRAGMVLGLQRTAGNAAICRALASGPRALARYEAGEHARFAGDTGGVVMINGVPVQKANIIAMGDFFRTPEAMNSADPKVLAALDAAITDDRRGRTKEVDPVTGEVPRIPGNADLQKITKPLGGGNTYMDLNKENQAHFAPPAGGPDPKGKDNKSTWERLHRQALDEAHQAAPTETSRGGPAPETPPGAPGAVPEKATVTNLFAAHYVTDAFSAGHLINKQEVMEQAKQAWGKMATDGSLLQQNKFTREVSEGVLADDKVKDKMKDKQIINVRELGAMTAAVLAGGPLPGSTTLATLMPRLFTNLYVDVTPTLLSELLHVTSRVQPGTFFNIFARLVHDKLNKDGVMVANDEATWKLSGDETLNTESLQRGKQAVAASERNLEEAAAFSGPLRYEEMFARVWRFVPRPTPEGAKFMDTVREEFTNAADPDTIKAAIELSIKEIDTAIDEMQKLYILRPKQGSAAPAGAP